MKDYKFSLFMRFIGHATEEELDNLNELYVNFFQPAMKLIKKRDSIS